MSMIFPGMDPYLEDLNTWKGTHTSLIVYMSDALRPGLRPRYVAAIKERVYLDGPAREIRPDLPRKSIAAGMAEPEADAPVTVVVPVEPVHEPYIAILDLHAGQRVVTVIEVVSPDDKLPGHGRESYLAKQDEVLSSDAHLVEIDLLRQGPHVLAVPEYNARQRCRYDYLTCVNRSFGRRDRYELYPRLLRERLPRIRVPLAEGDPDVALDIQAVLAQAYDTGGYRDLIDYARPCTPPLGVEDSSWVQERLREGIGAAASE